MEVTDSTLWLCFNASIAWFIVSFGFVRLFRSKALFFCLMVLPIILIPNLMQVSSDWLRWYLLSMMYGIIGLIGGVLVAEYQKTKLFLNSIHKPSFFVMITARFCIGLSAIYIVIYFAQSLVSEWIAASPILEMVLDFSIPRFEVGRGVFDLVSGSGVILAVGVIVLCVLLMIASLHFSKKFQRKMAEERK